VATGVVSIRIRRGDKVFHVHGENAGAEGVWLAEGQVQGIYDSPVKTTHKSGAFQIGSKYKGKKRGERRMVLGFHTTETAYNPYEYMDSGFRQLFQYELDKWDANRTPTTIEVETEMSGVRCLDVLMYEEPEFEAAQDPLMHQYGNLIMKLIANQPDWYQPDYTASFSSTATSGSGTITVSNPTDQPAYHRFILTPATWTLPDVQWVGGPAARTPGGDHVTRAMENILIPTGSGGAIVEWDRSQLTFRDTNNTNLQGQLGPNNFPVYEIPPQTPPTPLGIGYSSAPAGGAMAHVEVPRRWSRPWGMELQDEVTYLPPLGTVTFMVPGSWSYEIPENATHIDVVMLGGGGGGGASAMSPATGGSAAAWSTTTLLRSGIPSNKLYGVVGAGGAGGKKETWGVNPGANGTASTCKADGMTTITAAGGAGSGHIGHSTGDDVAGPILGYNGMPYTGGATQTTLGQPGHAPGGGGAAGKVWTSGAAGARGQVWIRAYTDGGS
jgi:hypothetical protein